jgi:VWFA-related protein
LIRIRTIIVWLAAMLAGAPAALAQADSGADIRYRLRTSVELVMVPVTVKDGRGGLVTDLGREDFTLLENGEPQAIRYFSTDPFPLSAVVLVDRGLDRDAREAMQRTLPVLAGALAPGDEFAVMAFDTYPRLALNFTSDPEELRQTLAQLELTAGEPAPPPASMAAGPMSAGARINAQPVGPGVTTSTSASPRTVKCLDDALYAAGMALRQREAGRRRVIFLVSDGRNSRLNVRTAEETLRLLLSEDITVFALGVGEARYPRGSRLLADYARATGGDVYAPGSLAGLEQAHKRVVEQARYQYTLVYAARPAPGSREYRRIEVQVRRAGAQAQARQGYYAGMPEH